MNITIIAFWGGKFSKAYMRSLGEVLNLIPRVYEALSPSELKESVIIVPSSSKNLAQIQMRHPSTPIYQVGPGYTNMDKLINFIDDLRAKK